MANRSTMSKANKTFTSKNKADYIFVGVMLLYPLLMFAIFYLGVNINSIILAFQKIDIYGNTSSAGFGNFIDFINMLSGDDGYLSIGFSNSIKMYAINLVICMPLYIFFSYILYKKCRGHKSMRAIIMIPQIVSTMLIAMVFRKFVEWALPDIMIKAFNLDKFPNLLTNPAYSFGTNIFYMIWVSFSVSLIVYPNAMNEIPSEVIESAQIDGVDNMMTELWYIILPLIYPTLSTFLITGFAGILTNAGPLVVFYMYAAPYETYNMGYYYFVKVMRATSFNGYPLLAAGGLLMTIFVAPLTHLFKYLLERFGPVAEY